MAEKLTRGEAVQYLTMQWDKLADLDSEPEYPVAKVKADVLAILEETGDKIGYVPAFRCLVKGLDPEESIRWGK